MKKLNIQFSLREGILIGLAGFAIGGLTTLILNTVQTVKLKNLNPQKYNCKINAVLEPQKTINNNTNSKGN